MDLGGKKRCKLAVFWDENAITGGVGIPKKRNLPHPSLYHCFQLIFYMTDLSTVLGTRGNVVIIYRFHGSFASLRPSSLVSIKSSNLKQSEKIWSNLKHCQFRWNARDCAGYAHLHGNSFPRKLRTWIFYELWYSAWTQRCQPSAFILTFCF